MIDVALGPADWVPADGWLPGTLAVAIDVVAGSTDVLMTLEEVADNRVTVVGEAPDSVAEDTVVCAPQLARLALAVFGIGAGYEPAASGGPDGGRLGSPARVLVGALVNARPLASRVAALVHEPGHEVRQVRMLCAGSPFGARVDDAYVAGVLVLLLLEELDAAAQLTDAAGIAVALASSYDSAVSALHAAATSRAMVGRREESDEILFACAARDEVGVVGELQMGRGDDGLDVIEAFSLPYTWMAGQDEREAPGV